VKACAGSTPVISAACLESHSVVEGGCFEKLGVTLGSSNLSLVAFEPVAQRIERLRAKQEARRFKSCRVRFAGVAQFGRGAGLRNQLMRVRISPPVSMISLAMQR
jgi:hypothetical protein